MDHMWHAAVLDTKFCSSLQRQLGMELHHRPQGALTAEKEQREQRRRDLVILYKLRYGSDPLGCEKKPAVFSAAAASPSSSSSSFSFCEAIGVDPWNGGVWNSFCEERRREFCVRCV
jgi:hypothetical protein